MAPTGVVMPEDRLHSRSGSNTGRRHARPVQGHPRQFVPAAGHRQATRHRQTAVDPGAQAAHAHTGRRMRRRRYRRGPIFVDSSGRRSRMLKLVALTTSGVLACSGVVLAATMLGSHARPPVVPLPDSVDAESTAPPQASAMAQPAVPLVAPTTPTPAPAVPRSAPPPMPSSKLSVPPPTSSISVPPSTTPEPTRVHPTRPNQNR